MLDLESVSGRVAGNTAGLIPGGRQPLEGAGGSASPTNFDWVAEPEVGDPAVREATGRCWDEWREVIDLWPGHTDGHATVARYLTEDHGVATIPTSPFLSRGAAPPVLRFCFAKRDETLERAAERLRRV